MTRLLVLARCQSCSSEKFGVKTEFAVVPQLSDANEPVAANPVPEGHFTVILLGDRPWESIG